MAGDGEECTGCCEGEFEDPLMFTKAAIRGSIMSVMRVRLLLCKERSDKMLDKTKKTLRRVELYAAGELAVKQRSEQTVLRSAFVGVGDHVLTREIK
jgi:hypothetical protein